MNDLVQGTEEWWHEHENEPRYYAPQKVRADDRLKKKKLINYFREVVASYRRKIQEGTSPGALDSEMRYMEVTLGILAKLK